MWWRLYNQDRASGMTHHRLCRRTKNNSAEAGAAVRRNYNQIHLVLAGNAHNLSGRVTMHNNFFDLQAVEFLAIGKLWQFALG